MTESEWLACADPQVMLEFMAEKGSDRKLRLFACACCRRIWSDIKDDRSRKAVEAAENFVDGLSTQADRESASSEAWAVVTEMAIRVEAHSATFAVAYAAARAIHRKRDVFAFAWQQVLEAIGRQQDQSKSLQREPVAQAGLLRDTLGNPYRPVANDPAWLTSTVAALAQAIYKERAFDRMPILADALEDAGCTSADFLDHCRQDGEHVRGCWVVDVLLGRE
jgi:hypothetical protein